MKKGTQVVCIDDTGISYLNLSGKIVKGHIYRVRDFYPANQELGLVDGIAVEGIYGKIDFVRLKNGQLVLVEHHFKKRRFAEIAAPLVIKEKQKRKKPKTILTGNEETELTETCLSVP